MKTLQINQTAAIAAYQKGNKEVKTLLENLFGKETFNLNIKDRVKSFDDVLEVLGVLGGATDNQLILLSYNGIDEMLLSAKAYLKVALLTQALNEGWKADWLNSNEYKYYIWFNKNSSGSGLVFDCVTDWGAGTVASSRLCFKSRDLAEYAAKQFKELYEDYFAM